MKKEDWINKIMESHEGIKKVNPPENLFPKINQRINQLKKDIIPFTWVKVAAALVITLTITEVIVLQQKNETKSEAVNIISKTNNSLYK